jgi:hypothetical protein
MLGTEPPLCLRSSLRSLVFAQAWGWPVNMSRYFLVSGSMEELVKDPFRAEGFRVGSELRWICSSGLSSASGIRSSEYSLRCILPELTSLAHLRMWFGERTNTRTSTRHILRLLRAHNLLRLELGSPSLSHNPRVSIRRPRDFWHPNHRLDRGTRSGRTMHDFISVSFLHGICRRTSNFALFHLSLVSALLSPCLTR